MEEEPRSFNAGELSNIRSKLFSVLNDDSEDASDLIDYSIAMIVNGKSASYIVEELKGMEMDICGTKDSEEIGRVIAPFLHKSSNIDENSGQVGAVDDGGEGNDVGSVRDNGIQPDDGKKVISFRNSGTKNALTMAGALNVKKVNKGNSMKMSGTPKQGKAQQNGHNNDSRQGKSQQIIHNNEKNNRQNQNDERNKFHGKNDNDRARQRNHPRDNRGAGRGGGRGGRVVRSLTSETFKRLSEHRERDNRDPQNGRGPPRNRNRNDRRGGNHGYFGDRDVQRGGGRGDRGRMMRGGPDRGRDGGRGGQHHRAGGRGHGFPQQSRGRGRDRERGRFGDSQGLGQRSKRRQQERQINTGRIHGGREDQRNGGDNLHQKNKKARLNEGDQNHNEAMKHSNEKFADEQYNQDTNYYDESEWYGWDGSGYYYDSYYDPYYWDGYYSGGRGAGRGRGRGGRGAMAGRSNQLISDKTLQLSNAQESEDNTENGAVLSAAKASPSPLVKAEFSTKLSYSGRGRGFVRGGRSWSRGGGREVVKAKVASMSWSRSRTSSQGVNPSENNSTEQSAT